MKGRQTIPVNRTFTLEELTQFMEERWDREQYGDFVVGHPTGAPSPQYIILPSTEHWCVIVYPKEDGLLKKGPKVVLTSTLGKSGAHKMLEHGSRVSRYDSTYAKIQRAKNQRELNRELGGPAEEILQEYTAYMRQLLREAGFTQ